MPRKRRPAPRREFERLHDLCIFTGGQAQCLDRPLVLAPKGLAATAIMAANGTMRPALAHLEAGCVQPDIGPLAGERAFQEFADALVIPHGS